MMKTSSIHTQSSAKGKARSALWRDMKRWSNRPYSPRLCQVAVTKPHLEASKLTRANSTSAVAKGYHVRM